MEGPLCKFRKLTQQESYTTFNHLEISHVLQDDLNRNLKQKSSHCVSFLFILFSVFCRHSMYLYRYVVESTTCKGANCTYSWNRRLMCPYPRGVVPPGGAGVAMALPEFGWLVNPISRFSYLRLPTALKSCRKTVDENMSYFYYWYIRLFRLKNFMNPQI